MNIVHMLEQEQEKLVNITFDELQEVLDQFIPDEDRRAQIMDWILVIHHLKQETHI